MVKQGREDIPKGWRPEEKDGDGENRSDKKMDKKKHEEILNVVGDWMNRMCPEDVKPKDNMQGGSVAGPSIPGRVGSYINTMSGMNAPSLTRIDKKRVLEKKNRLNFVRRYFPDTVMSCSWKRSGYDGETYRRMTQQITLRLAYQL